MSDYNFTQRFLDPEKVLFRAGLATGQSLADFGAGSGHYALAAGKIVGARGKVYVVDVLESSLAHVSADARLRKLKNIQTVQADLEKSSGIKQIPEGLCDMVLFANIFHDVKNHQGLLAEGYRALKTGGKFVVVEWNDNPSPIGPKVARRVSSDQIKKFITDAGLKFETAVETDSYHYGLIFIK